MSVRALQATILILAAAALVEVGYLWGTRGGPADPEIVLLPVGEPEPVGQIPAPPLPGLAAAEPPARPPEAVHGLPRRRPPRRAGKAVVVDSQAVADCARSGGPLCGMPR